ncbi:MAG TPA: transposase [Pyrinomonadaceae bacterium]|nr:transposase [Pyrinomonadaceae bacterium]
MKGSAVAEICNEHQINQSQYYLWRGQFLQNAGKVFDVPQKAQQQTRLERQNEKLKAMVGELTMELKKTIGKSPSLPRCCSSVGRRIAAQADSSD